MAQPELDQNIKDFLFTAPVVEIDGKSWEQPPTFCNVNYSACAVLLPGQVFMSFLT